jgi:hypothetical protein
MSQHYVCSECEGDPCKLVVEGAVYQPTYCPLFSSSDAEWEEEAPQESSVEAGEPAKQHGQQSICAHHIKGASCPFTSSGVSPMTNTEKLNEVKRIANNALLLATQSDYYASLWEILETIDPELCEDGEPELRWIERVSCPTTK